MDSNPYQIAHGELLQVWKVVQENQRAFDEILMKIRSLAVLYAGGVASAGLAAKWSDGRLVGVFILLVTVPWLGLYVIDRFYYHILLQGAVFQAGQLEKALFAGTGLPSPSESLRDYNHRFPIPGTRIKSGGQKVSAFYATPFVLAVFLGFDSFLETHLRLGGSRFAWMNAHASDVSLAFSLIMAFMFMIAFILIEHDQRKRVEQYLAERETA